MNDQTLLALASKMSALVEKFERQCEQSGTELRRLSQQVPAVVRQAADDQWRGVPEAVLADVRRGIEGPLADHERRLREAGEQVHQASVALSAQLRRAEALHRHLVWKVAGITLGSLVLMLGGGSWLSRHYYDEIRKNQVSATLLKAYNEADVTLCDGRLCVKTDKSAKPHGDYLPVKPR
ncbi:MULTISPECIES: hypothetical protein [unclassified Variovorax]|uniref:hypothetical protein n=1 Tax=unclassified Variovorax TaxID=663243 RepID=UPI002574A671|nr:MULTISPECIES: hypothetical protein [unclassified Variovorax]MDM0091090.1 hypothetical protein [Variovorax sp. J22G40]MDM0148908.1 hypothetical protein [Variovorax sp. J2P1-31]